MKWAYEQFEQALKRGRKICPKPAFQSMRTADDTACAIGCMILGAGIPLRIAKGNMDNGKSIYDFEQMTGLSYLHVYTLTKENDYGYTYFGDKSNRDAVVLERLKVILSDV